MDSWCNRCKYCQVIRYVRDGEDTTIMNCLINPRLKIDQIAVSGCTSFEKFKSPNNFLERIGMVK